jgi:transglutaminase-like putative cysteine protease
MLILESQDLTEYLAASEIIDYRHPSVRDRAVELARSTADSLDLVRVVYEWVRDCIHHSCDIGSSRVTLAASEVLEYNEGLCFAKSHLLAALLRCLEVPVGFCYQKLIFSDDRPDVFTLHGFNAVYLRSIDRWVRVDARGNKEGVVAEFDPESERLAFPTRIDLGEELFPTIYRQPNLPVIGVLQQFDRLSDAVANLPDTL